MYCSKCGKQIDDNAKFCPYCGFNVSKSNNTQDNNTNMSNKEWFYYKDSEKIGPLSTEDIKLHIQSGHVKRDTMVWSAGLESWIRADNSEIAVFLNDVQPDIPIGIIPEKWVWALSTVPLFVGIILNAICMAFGISTFFSTVIVIALNIYFLTKDIQELKYVGIDPEKWLYLGAVIVSVYVFVRESKTNKNYIPAIVHLVLFIFSLFV